MLALAVGVLGCFLGYVYVALRAPPPKICGSPGGPPVTSPRIKLSDGRHLAYKERGVSREDAMHKIIISHGFNDSKDFHLPVSEELIQVHRIYILSLDRAGYGESDPNPTRSVKSDALDLQELADKLKLGPKFYVIGISMGAYPAYGCLKYIPHSPSDIEIIKRSSETPKEGQEKVTQQGAHECLHRDLMVGLGNWGFSPTDISNPFPDQEGSVRLWQGYEDRVIPMVLNRYLAQKLPWIQYHEVPDTGHLMIYDSTYCEAIFKTLISA